MGMKKANDFTILSLPAWLKSDLKIYQISCHNEHVLEAMQFATFVVNLSVTVVKRLKKFKSSMSSGSFYIIIDADTSGALQPETNVKKI